MQKGNLRSVTSFKASIISLASGLVWFMIAYIPDFNPLTVLGFVCACSLILIGVISMLQMNSNKASGLIFGGVQLLLVAVILVALLYQFIGDLSELKEAMVALRLKVALIYLIPSAGAVISAIFFLKGRKEFTEIQL